MRQKFGFLALVGLLLIVGVASRFQNGQSVGSSNVATNIKPVDGDTFWFNGTKVRLSAVDTPEPTKYGNAECPYEAELGDRASAFTKNIITTRKIGIEWSGKTDQYKRALVKVRVKDQYLGDMLIDAGLAMPWKGRQFDWCHAQ